MRTSQIAAATRIAMDAAAVHAAVRAGHAAQLFADLADVGIVFDQRLGRMQFLPENIRLRPDHNHPLGIACDAQPELVTVNNAGIPAFLSTYLDPNLIRVLNSPMKAAEIAGETKKGDWLSTVLQFPVIELDGEVSSYGDYNANGSVEVNTNFPTRQTYHYQTWTQWGEKELANAGLAAISWAAELNAASALILNKFQNRSYFFGISGLAIYGLLNDPALYAPIAPTAQWNLNSTSSETVYDDVRRLFLQLVTQANGTVDATMSLTLACSPETSVAFQKTNQFGLNVWDLIKKNFPNIRLVVAVEYSTEGGELVQLFVDEIEGQETVTTSFTEKMRAHNLEVYSSYYRQKKSQGTSGAIYFRPFGVSQMLGV